MGPFGSHVTLNFPNPSRKKTKPLKRPPSHTNEYIQLSQKPCSLCTNTPFSRTCLPYAVTGRVHGPRGDDCRVKQPPASREVSCQRLSQRCLGSTLNGVGDGEAVKQPKSRGGQPVVVGIMDQGEELCPIVCEAARYCVAMGCFGPG